MDPRPNYFDLGDFPLPEGVTADITFYLEDHSGQILTPDDLDTLELSYYEKETGSIINGRQNQDVLNTNDVQVSAEGNVTWSVQAADTVLVERDALKHRLESSYGIYYEIHIARFKWTYGGGGDTGIGEIALYVQKVNEPPAP